MKKLFCWAALAVLLTLAASGPVPSVSAEKAATFADGPYDYSLRQDGTAEIINYRGSEEELAIPSALNGHAVTAIGAEAFSYCVGLTDVTIPDGVTAIGEAAFSGCKSLTGLTIPGSVTAIGDYAFSYCTGLTGVTIPDGVTAIGDQAFSGCSSLTIVTIPDSVTEMGANPFEECKKLMDIVVSPDHSYLAVIDGVLFSKPDKRLISYPRALNGEVYAIPEGTLTIGDCAFFWCDSLTGVTIPDSVTAIGNGAFQWCRGLKNIAIPDGVTEIGDYAFSRCESLTDVTIPNGVTAIGISVLKAAAA